MLCWFGFMIEVSVTTVLCICYLRGNFNVAQHYTIQMPLHSSSQVTLRDVGGWGTHSLSVLSLLTWYNHPKLSRIKQVTSLNLYRNVLLETVTDNKDRIVDFHLINKLQGVSSKTSPKLLYSSVMLSNEVNIWLPQFYMLREINRWAQFSF